MGPWCQLFVINQAYIRTRARVYGDLGGVFPNFVFKYPYNLFKIKILKDILRGHVHFKAIAESCNKLKSLWFRWDVSKGMRKIFLGVGIHFD
jgi:hypothetical protein